MKNAVLMIFVVWSNIAQAQYCSKIEGVAINCFDALGQRQGLWKERILVPTDEIYRANGGSEKFDSIYSYVTTAEGYYINDVPVKSTWVYYPNHAEISQSYLLNYTVNKEDETFTEYRYCYELHYKKDGTIVDGKLYCKLDTIDISLQENSYFFRFKNGTLVEIKKGNDRKLWLEIWR